MQQILWRIIPLNPPAYLRRCPKCARERFLSGECFRVNANGSRIDVWLVYRCAACKATWNIAILKRVPASSIPPQHYRAFAVNDAALALRYSLDRRILFANHVQADYASVLFQIEGDVPNSDHEDVLIRMCPSIPVDVPAMRLVAQKLGVSLSRVKRMAERGMLTGDMDLRKAKLTHEIEFVLHEGWQGCDRKREQDSCLLERA